MQIHGAEEIKLKYWNEQKLCVWSLLTVSYITNDKSLVLYA